MLNLSYQWFVLSYKQNRSQDLQEWSDQSQGHIHLHFQNQDWKPVLLGILFQGQKIIQKNVTVQLKYGLQLVFISAPHSSLLLSVQIQVLPYAVTKGEILFLSPLLWHSVAMVMKKKHKNYMLTVPDTAKENPCTIMCTYSSCAIHMVRVRLYFISALGVPRTKQCLAHSLSHLPAEWLAQTYFFYSGHREMSRRLILDKVGRAMSLMFLQQLEGQRQSHGLQDVEQYRVSSSYNESVSGVTWSAAVLLIKKAPNSLIPNGIWDATAKPELCFNMDSN